MRGNKSRYSSVFSCRTGPLLASGLSPDGVFGRLVLVARRSVGLRMFSLSCKASMNSCLLRIAGAERAIPADTAGCLTLDEGEGRWVDADR